MHDGIDEAKRHIDHALRDGQSSLDLSGLQLQTVPPGLSDLTNLTTLTLDDNQLTALPDTLGNLTNLTTLTLDDNQLTALPDTLGNLTNLTTLTLYDNQLTALPDTLGNLTNLTTLTLHDNHPLTSPPPEIVIEGSRSILSFIRARADGSSEQWVSKLLVVGEGGVGKTSLLKALADDRHDPDEPTTHGLTIRSLSLDHPTRPSVRMLLNAWDFGGQEIYHATHQFFLTNRSLFLLLWNSRLGWEQGKLRYWLDIITARAPESPIILVATHIEGRPVDLPIDDLRREYPRIVGSLSVDNESRFGIDALLTRLADEAAALPLMGSEWPTTWLAAAESLRNSLKKCVTPEGMWQLMSDAGVRDAAQQRYIAIALHQLGDILYYHEDHELSQTVVLRPEWVNEYISKVLDSEEVAATDGLLTYQHLKDLWWDLDRGLREHFLGMMDKYDLSYRVEGGSTGDLSLVVERLPWNPPPFQDEWDERGSAPDAHEIRVLYRLSTMPPGIPTWFIARSHRFSTKTHWRSGVLLRHADGRHVALVRADRHRNTVELTVRGPAPAAFFSILDDGLNLTLERFPGLDILRQVPCPCQDGTGESCAELFDYVDLQSRLNRTPPRYEIECRKSGEDVYVPKLLHGLAPSERESTRAGIEQIRKSITQVDEKLEKLTEQAEYSQRMFLKLQRLAQIQQEARCPSIVALVPVTRNRVAERVAGAAYELRLYCEEPGAWHRLPEPAGCYRVTEPADWLRKFGPYLQYLLTVLKHAAPLAGPVLGVSVDKLDEQLKADCELMTELVAQAPAQLRHQDELPRGLDVSPTARAASDADFRALQAMLGELDPNSVWGGLSRYTTPEGLTLYLCREHLAAYHRRAQA